MKNFLHQRSKSLLAFAVGLTILSSSFAGEVYADEGYIDWNDLANDSNTTWTTTDIYNKNGDFKVTVNNVTLNENKNIGSSGTKSLGTNNTNTYTIAGATKNIDLTFKGDIWSNHDHDMTIKNLNTLQITNGTRGLLANFGNDRGEHWTDYTNNGGIHLSDITTVNISSTYNAIFSNILGKIDLQGIDNLILASEFNAIYCDYGSLIDINATNTAITSNGRAIIATAGNAQNIYTWHDASLETDYPLPVINIKSDTLTIAAATSGRAASAVYSDPGATINLGSAEKKIKQLTFVKDAGANMNLYSDSHIYEDQRFIEYSNEHRFDYYGRYSDTIPDDETAKYYKLYQAKINVYAENAEFNANTNAINAYNKALIYVNADNAVINSNYATVAAGAGATVTIEGKNLTINNTNCLNNAQVVDNENAKVAIGSGGLLNPSEYGDTEVNAGNIDIKANNKLAINGNIVIKANPDAAAGNSISINKDNTTALVNITGDIYTNNGNEVHLSLGDGSAASQNGNAADRQAGRSTLTGAILDKASTAESFSFSDTSFSEKGTNLKMKDATWNVTADSEVAKVDMAGNSIIDLTQRNEAATVDMAGSSTIGRTHDHDFQKLKINNLSGSGTIRMDYDDSQSSTDGSTADKLFINNHSGTHCLYLNEVHGATSLTGNAEGTVLVSVVNESGDFKAASDDNLTWNIYELNKKESTTTGYNIDWYLAKNTNPTPSTQGPTRAEAATLKAHNMSYYLWRDQSERLTKRLGITCFDEERAGVWTKMSNSDISGSGIYGSDAKVKTYTIGYDFKHNSDKHLTAADTNKTRDFSGLAFTYIKGSSSMDGYKVSDALQVAGGRSDIRGGALTAYHTHTSQSGSYADYVLRYSSYDNDFKLDGVNGSAKSHGLQASAEYGHRLENNHGLFVTPNAQFTLGRLYNKAFTTSNGVHVASDHLNSAILSMGVDVGQTLGDQSQVYAKVRYNTELGDRVSAAFYKGVKSDFCNGDSNGSWWEYGLGFDIKAGHASHLFMDAERASGSGFSKDWSWRIGARFDF